MASLKAICAGPNCPLFFGEDSWATDSCCPLFLGWTIGSRAVGCILQKLSPTPYHVILKSKSNKPSICFVSFRIYAHDNNFTRPPVPVGPPNVNSGTTATILDSNACILYGCEGGLTEIRWSINICRKLQAVSGFDLHSFSKLIEIFQGKPLHLQLHQQLHQQLHLQLQLQLQLQWHLQQLQKHVCS